MSLSSWLSRLKSNPDFLQLALTLGIVVIALLLVRLTRRMLRRKYENPRDPQLLAALIGTRNGIVGVAAFLIFVIWLTEIRHALFSLAAIAAAFMLISKEFWMNLFGMLLRTMGQPFTVGDVIEIQGHTGRVVDMDSLTFKLLAYGPMGLVSSRLVELPNSILLTQPVVNLSQAGAFGFQFMRICLPSTVDIPKAHQILDMAALEICEPYMKDAQDWFERKGNQWHVDYPDASVRTLIESKTHEQVDLVVRFPCPSARRVQIQQDITQAFYREWARTQSPDRPPDFRSN